MSNLTLIEPPVGFPVELDAIKPFLRLGDTGEDDLVRGLIESATARLERLAGMALLARILERDFGQLIGPWPHRGLPLRPGPVSQLLIVRIDGDEDDSAGVPYTDRFQLDCGQLVLVGEDPLARQCAHVAVQFRAGYGATADIPADLRLAVTLLVAASYRDGPDPASSSTRLPEQVAALVALHREIRV